MPATARSARLALVLCGVAGAVPLAGRLVGGADAQTDPAAAPPQVAIASPGRGKAVTVTGADALGPGPTTLAFTGPAKGEVDFEVAALKPGVTRDQVVAALAKLKGPPTPITKLADFSMGGSTGQGSRTYTATTTLRATTYLVVDVTSDKAPPKVVGSFAVAGTAAPATAPTPDATVRLDDFAFHPSGALPSTGVVRFVDDGPSPHFAVMARVPSPAVGRKVLELLRTGRESAAEKLITGESEPLGLISEGVSDDVAFDHVKRGTYVMACFYGDARSHGREHTMLGMERLVTVR